MEHWLEREIGLLSEIIQNHSDKSVIPNVNILNYIDRYTFITMVFML